MNRDDVFYILVIAAALVVFAGGFIHLMMSLIVW